MNAKNMRAIISLRILSFFLFVATTGNATAADSLETTKLTVVAARTSGKIQLSGKLDDPNWMLAQPVALLYEVTPGENTPATQQTTVRVVYNDQYVYFGFDCKDTLSGRDPAPILPTATNRGTTIGFSSFSIRMAIINARMSSW